LLSFWFGADRHLSAVLLFQHGLRQGFFVCRVELAQELPFEEVNILDESISWDPVMSIVIARCGRKKRPNLKGSF